MVKFSATRLEKIFKNLILATLILNVLMFAVMFFTPEEVKKLYENISPGLFDPNVGFIISVINLIIYLTSLILLYNFINFGKPLFLFSFIVGVLLSFAMNTTISIMGPYVYALDRLLDTISGAILIFLYFTSIKDKFSR